MYHDSRDRVDDALHNVKKEIIDRPDTFWESFVGVFGNVIDHIMDNMPIVNVPLRLFSGVMKALLPGSKHNRTTITQGR